MTTLAIDQPHDRGRGLGAVLRKELAPFPGRMDAVWRFVISSAVVIVCSMALQVPFMGFSLIMVFFTTQENTVLTRLAATMLIIGATAAVVLSILLLKFTMGYPMWRILGACGIAFCGIYFMRISKLGSIGYMVAMTVVYGQSLVDVIDDPETLTRALLWVWPTACYPVIVAVVVNGLFRPAHPVRLLTREIARQLNDVSAQLDARLNRLPSPALEVDALASGALLLHRHLGFATQGDAEFGKEKGRHLMRIAAIDRLRTAAAHLSQLPAGPLSAAQQELLGQVQESCAALSLSLEKTLPFTSPPVLPESAGHEDGMMGILREMAHALHSFAEADTTPMSEAPPTKKGLLAADAFSNPAYGRFALKTVLATMLCYVIYTGIQWPGIHTAMLTCIILALPSLGLTAHKGLTRVIGCAIGSLIALAATVFVMPHLDSIVGLLGMTLPVIALGAWIAAGSNRSNYVGVQIMFAFALALLGHFGPTIDLNEIRDRMVGILLGVAVSLAVSTLLWPERDSDNLKTMLGRLLRAVSGLLRAGTESENEDGKRAAIDKARLQGWTLLSQNRELQANIALEPGWQHAHDSVTPDLTTWLAQVQEALFAVNSLKLQLLPARPHLPEPVIAGFDTWLDSAARELDWMADRFEGTAGDDDPAEQVPDPVPPPAGPASEPLADLHSAASAVHERIAQLLSHFRAEDTQPHPSHS